MAKAKHWGACASGYRPKGWPGLTLMMGLLLATGWPAMAQVPQRVDLHARFHPEKQPYAYAIPLLKPLPGVQALRASECGRCHRQIYQDWRRSTHARAYRDLQFQAEVRKADSPRWLCLNCHIPVQNQRRRLVLGLEDGDVLKPITRPNERFDPKMRLEGVTCAGCHVRVDSATGRSFVIGPNGSQLAPHPVRQNRTFLHQICRRCHNPQGKAITPNLVCWFTTYAEWQQAAEVLKSQPDSLPDCVSCHMPVTRARLAQGFAALPVRDLNHHFWEGGGVPKWYSDYDSLLVRGFRPGLDVQVLAVQAQGKDSLRVRLLLANRRAGHWIPTADPERFFLIQVRLEKPDGGVLAERRYRIGQTWRWNPARKVGDNRLKAGEERLYQTSLPFPESLAGDMRLVVQAYHVRLQKKTAAYLMTHTPAIPDPLWPELLEQIRHLPRYYPMATCIFRQEFDPATGRLLKGYSLKELLRQSRQEQEKPLLLREY